MSYCEKFVVRGREFWSPLRTEHYLQGGGRGYKTAGCGIKVLPLQKGEGKRYSHAEGWGVGGTKRFELDTYVLAMLKGTGVHPFSEGGGRKVLPCLEREGLPNCYPPSPPFLPSCN